MRKYGSEIPWSEVQYEPWYVKTYWGQHALLTIVDGKLYCQWVAPDGQCKSMDLVIPKSLRIQDMTQAHAGFYGGPHWSPKDSVCAAA